MAGVGEASVDGVVRRADVTRILTSNVALHHSQHSRLEYLDSARGE